MGRKSPFPRNQEWSSANAKTLRSWFLLVGRGERGRSSVNKFAGKRSDHALHRKAMSPIGTNQAFVYLSRKVSWVELISSCHVVHHCSFDISNWFNEGEVSSQSRFVVPLMVATAQLKSHRFCFIWMAYTAVVCHSQWALLILSIV